MIQIYLDCNYPKNLENALQLIHKLQMPHGFNVIRTQQFDEKDISNKVVFLFDTSKKGIDVVTEKHYEAGFKVFAFKLNSTERIDFFQLSLSTIHLWPKILTAINEGAKPFVFTYNYNGKALKKAKG